MQVISQSGAEARHPVRLRVRCSSCPRACAIEEGGYGVCQVRVREGDAVVISGRGLAAGFLVEPVEAFDLAHFLPGTLALAVGRGGTNLRDSAAHGGQRTGRFDARESMLMPPGRIARLASELGCATVALGGTDPATVPEYAAEVAATCRDQGLHTVALTRGYMLPHVRVDVFRHVDAARVELLGFTERAYRAAGGHLAAVRETLAYLAGATGVWLEVALRLLPGRNDSVSELHRLAAWMVAELGPGVPFHLKTAHLTGTSSQDELNAAGIAVARAERIARDQGLHHVYTDDLFDRRTRTTRCHACGTPLLKREWFLVTDWHLEDGDRCPGCGTRCAGIFPRAAPAAGVEAPLLETGLSEAS